MHSSPTLGQLQDGGLAVGAFPIMHQITGGDVEGAPGADVGAVGPVAGGAAMAVGHPACMGMRGEMSRMGV